jgi:hypothetical protein
MVGLLIAIALSYMLVGRLRSTNYVENMISRTPLDASQLHLRAQ